jgi:hypothetical protein
VLVSLELLESPVSLVLVSVSLAFFEHEVVPVQELISLDLLRSAVLQVPVTVLVSESLALSESMVSKVLLTSVVLLVSIISHKLLSVSLFEISLPLVSLVEEESVFSQVPSETQASEALPTV